MRASCRPSMPSTDARIGTRNVVILMWAVAAFSLYVSFGLNSLSTDDAMRLVEVRDFLAGQSWFDLTQYRLNPPAGVEMHWSRLIDLALALLIKSGAMVVSRPAAEAAALVVWPTAMLLVFLAGVSRLARELAGHTAARVAVVFAVLMAPVLQHFRAGAIDHHNVQLALTIWSLALFARLPARPRDSAIAGALSALSVAIGQEMVAAVAVLAAVVGLRWVVAGEDTKHATIAYAMALAAGSLVLGVATIAPARYFAVDCDAISIAQVGALGLGGFGLTALAVMPRLNSVASRMFAAAALAALIAAAVEIGAPQCLGDPYGKLDPRLITLWLASVSEGRNIYCWRAICRSRYRRISAFRWQRWCSARSGARVKADRSAGAGSPAPPPRRCSCCPPPGNCASPPPPMRWAPCWSLPHCCKCFRP